MKSWRANGRPCLYPRDPTAFNDAEATQSLALLHKRAGPVCPYDGELPRPVVVKARSTTPLASTNRAREEFINGHWRNNVDIDWNRCYDGDRLVDPNAFY